MAGDRDEQTLMAARNSGKPEMQAALQGVIHMSHLYASSTRDPRATSLRRKVSAQVFGELIRKARMADGRTLEEIAPLAGLTVP